MQYKIRILSEVEALRFYKSYKGKEKYLLISISDKEGDIIFDKKENIILHQYYFADIQNDIHPRLKLMSKEQAKDIKQVLLKFIRQGGKNIIVHCYAGISRSGAVGCVLAKYLNGDDTYLWEQGGIYPNKYVYKLMCEVFNLDYSDEEFINKQRISTRLLDSSFDKMFIIKK